MFCPNMFLVNADQMSTSRPGRNLRRFHIAVAKLVPKAFDFWHGGSAWILGPLLVGLIAVFLAVQNGYAGNVNKMPFANFPVAQPIIMPAGFALIAFVTARYFPGIAGGGIPPTIAALDEAAPNKNKLLSPHIVLVSSSWRSAVFS
jgi:H+/Cl- antiporter ClcA